MRTLALPVALSSRSKIVAALLGGFLLLAFASYAWASGPSAKVAVDLIQINGAPVTTDRDNTFLGGETVTFKVTVTNQETDAGTENNLVGTHAFITESNKFTVVTPPPAGQQTITPGQNVQYNVDVQVASNYTLESGDKMTTEVEARFNGNDNDTQDLSVRLYVSRVFITKTAAATVQPNQPLAYTITLLSDGGKPATNVVVTDILEARLVPPSPLPTGCVFNTGTRLLTCTVGTVPFNVQSPTKIQFQPTVSGTACGITTKISNQAMMAADHLSSPAATAVVQTTVTCPTPSPSPSPTPTPTPTPSATPSATPIPTPTPSPTSTPTPSPSSSSSAGSASGSVSGASSGSSAGSGRVLGASSVVARVSAADLKAKDYIPFATVATTVEKLFKQMFGRKITAAESTCWKLRARSDKATVSKLKKEMLSHKAKGTTGFTKTCQAPKLDKSLVPVLFKLVYGRVPSASELKYWNARHKSKPRLDELRGAMLFQKAKGITH